MPVEDRTDHRGVHLHVAMDEDVAEAHDPPVHLDAPRRNPSRGSQAVEELGIRPWLAEVQARHDRGGDVDHRLDGRLERMLDESQLNRVLGKAVRTGMQPQPLDRIDDVGQALFQQIVVPHAERIAARR